MTLMKMTSLVTLTALLAAGLTFAGFAAAPRPNILHIVADDLGWKDVGFNGGTDIKTPNLDRLAAGGAKFSQFYVQNMCTPTRACLMTGRYPYRYGLQTIVIPTAAGYGLDPSEYLLPQCLGDAGYKTAIIGKWHLGHADKKYWPRQRGFDYQYGAMIGELDYFTHDEHGVLDWFRNNKPVREKGYTTTLLGDDAVKYINRQEPNRPFYLYLTFNAPHTPYQAPKEYIDKYSSIPEPTRRTYAAMVDCLDENVGKVVAALDKQGLRDNTLIIFHSDNGGTTDKMFAGQMADMSKVVLPCDNGPYRNGKGSLFEGGSRVCALANWPGRIKAQTVDGIIHAVDLYPTLAALAGASTAKCKPLDGVNVWDTIADGRASPRTEFFYNIEPFRAGIRQGDWKLIWRTMLPSSVDLYNLAEDPYEKNNLAAAHPDKVAAMQARLEAASKEAAKPMALGWIVQEAMKSATPLLPTDEGFYTDGDGGNMTPKIGTAH